MWPDLNCSGQVRWDSPIIGNIALSSVGELLIYEDAASSFSFISWYISSIISLPLHSCFTKDYQSFLTGEVPIKTSQQLSYFRTHYIFPRHSEERCLRQSGNLSFNKEKSAKSQSERMPSSFLSLSQPPRFSIWSSVWTGIKLSQLRATSPQEEDKNTLHQRIKIIWTDRLSDSDWEVSSNVVALTDVIIVRLICSLIHIVHFQHDLRTVHMCFTMWLICTLQMISLVQMHVFCIP